MLKNWVADIATIRMTVTILTSSRSLERNVAEIGAPNRVEASTSPAMSAVSGPSESRPRPW